MINFKKLGVLFLVGIILGFFYSIAVFKSERSLRVLASSAILRVKNKVPNIQKSLPREVMESYLNAWENADPNKMYGYISSTEKLSMNKKEYIQQFEEYPVRPVKHKFISLEAKNNKAIIKYQIGWPDFSTVESVEREEVFHLVKEGDNWRIKEESSLED